MFCMSTKTAAATPPPASAPTTCMPIYYASEDKQIRKHCKRCLNAGIPRVKTAVYCRKCQVPLCLSAKNNCFKLWHDNQLRGKGNLGGAVFSLDFTASVNSCECACFLSLLINKCFILIQTSEAFYGFL